jgi:hypothetical protein
VGRDSSATPFRFGPAGKNDQTERHWRRISELVLKLSSAPTKNLKKFEAEKPLQLVAIRTSESLKEAFEQSIVGLQNLNYRSPRNVWKSKQ